MASAAREAAPGSTAAEGDTARPGLGRLLALAAILWGLAEATFFFVIPDVLLSGIALRRRRLAFAACAWAVAGALAGGAWMHRWGGEAPAGARGFLDRVPAVAPAMIERVENELERHGLVALLWGPARGTPYKIYAVESGAAGHAPAPFLLVSIPARLLRFALVTALAAWIARRFLPGARPRTLYVWWGGAWLAVYASYFSIFGF